jgi:hypothetical protein
VDDFDVQSKQLRPKIEQFAKDRMAWISDLEGAEKYEGGFFNGEK